MEVNRWYNEIRLKSGVIYTTDYVLSETITLFFRRLPFNAARHSMERMQESIRANYLSVEWITPERFERAKGLRLRFRDKPRISFTDLTSMAVMEELGVNKILTGDAHFARVGMGFRMLP